MKSKKQSEPEYGKSDYYAGESGEAYFTRQMRNAALGAQVNTAKFSTWIHPGDSVLDFGCSGGWLLKELNPKVKVGVELNHLHHAYCEKNGVEVFDNTSALKGRSFSRIISHHCLEHVPYPIQALQELRDLLAEDGLMVLVVPIDDWRVQRNISAKDNDHHLHTWTPLLLKNTLQEAGFEVKEIRVLTHAWPKLWKSFYHYLPRTLFDLICVLWSVLAKRRQLLAVAKKVRLD